MEEHRCAGFILDGVCGVCRPASPFDGKFPLHRLLILIELPTAKNATLQRKLKNRATRVTLSSHHKNRVICEVWQFS